LKGLSALAHAYAANGDIEKANECIAKLKLRQAQEPNVVLDLDFAFIYTGFNDRDKAYYYLDRTINQRMELPAQGSFIAFAIHSSVKTSKLIPGIFSF
jgi:hypothetical protein